MSIFCRMFYFLAACHSPFLSQLPAITQDSKSGPLLSKPESLSRKGLPSDLNGTNILHFKGISLDYTQFIEKLDKSGRAEDIDEIKFENVRFNNIPQEPLRVFMPNLRKFTFGFDPWSKFDGNGSTIEFNNFPISEKNLDKILFFYTDRRNPNWPLRDIWRTRVDISIYSWRPCRYVDCIDKILGINHSMREFYSNLNFTNVFDLNYVRRLSLKGEVIEHVEISKELRYLSLSEFKPKGIKGFSWLKFFDKLTSLHLSFINESPTEVLDLSLLSGMKYLKHLSFWKTRVENSQKIVLKLDTLGIGQGVQIPKYFDENNDEINLDAQFFTYLRPRKVGLFFKNPSFEIISQFMRNNYTSYIFSEYPTPPIDDADLDQNFEIFTKIAQELVLYPGDHFIMKKSHINNKWIGKKIKNDMFTCPITNDFLGNPTFEQNIREKVEQIRISRAKMAVQERNMKIVEIDGKFEQNKFPPPKVQAGEVGLLYFNNIEFEIEPFLNSLRQFENLQYLIIENSLSFGSFSKFTAKGNKIYWPYLKLFSYHETYSGDYKQLKTENNQEQSLEESHDENLNILTDISVMRDLLFFTKTKFKHWDLQYIWDSGCDLSLSWGNMKYFEIDHDKGVFSSYVDYCDQLLNRHMMGLKSLNLKNCDVKQENLHKDLLNLQLVHVNFVESDPGDKDLFDGFEYFHKLENFTCNKCLSNRYGTIRAPITSPPSLKGFEHIPVEGEDLKISGILQLESVFLGGFPNGVKNISRFIYAKKLGLLSPIEVDPEIINSVLQIPSLDWFLFTYKGWDSVHQGDFEELNQVLYGSGVSQIIQNGPKTVSSSSSDKISKYSIDISPNGVVLETSSGAWSGRREELNFEHKFHINDQFAFSRLKYLPRIANMYTSLVNLSVSFVKLQNISIDLDDILARISNRLEYLNAN